MYLNIVKDAIFGCKINVMMRKESLIVFAVSYNVIML